MIWVVFSKQEGFEAREPIIAGAFQSSIADMLAILILRAKENGNFRGLVPHLVDGGLPILQYADGTILIENNLVEARCLKVVLCAFEKIFDLKINFHESKLSCFREAKEKAGDFVQLFGCSEGSLLSIYLGIPMRATVEFLIIK